MIVWLKKSFNKCHFLFSFVKKTTNYSIKNITSLLFLSIFVGNSSTYNPSKIEKTFAKIYIKTSLTAYNIQLLWMLWNEQIFIQKA